MSNKFVKQSTMTGITTEDDTKIPKVFQLQTSHLFKNQEKTGKNSSELSINCELKDI